MKYLLIGLGGGMGALARYVVSGWGQAIAGGLFPLGTFIANVVGCVLIGFFAGAFSGPILIREEYRMAIVVGFLGGFTTFSSYAWETFAMLNDGQWVRPLANIMLSNLACLAAVWAGYRVAERLYGG